MVVIINVIAEESVAIDIKVSLLIPIRAHAAKSLELEANIRVKDFF